MTMPFDKCPRCAAEHAIIACPYVKAIEVQDGDFQTITRVEFRTPIDYPPQRQIMAAPEPDYPRLGPKAAA